MVGWIIQGLGGGMQGRSGSYRGGVGQAELGWVGHAGLGWCGDGVGM